MQEKSLLINKIREWNTSFIGKKTEINFLKSEYAKYFSKKNDINKNGGWSELYYLAVGKKAPKIRGGSKITKEDLFAEYSHLQIISGVYDRGLKIKEIDSLNPKYSGSMFKKRFSGGLGRFFTEYQKWENKELKLIPKRVYVGKAAEYLAVAELLFKHFNAQLISVDEGLDVMAYKDNKFKLFQVKFGEYNSKLQLQQINITKSSFDRNMSANIYYMFILSRNGFRDFLILPVFVLEGLIKTGLQKIPCTILYKNKDVYINKISPSNKVTKYLNSSGWKNLEYS